MGPVYILYVGVR